MLEVANYDIRRFNTDNIVKVAGMFKSYVCRMEVGTYSIVMLAGMFRG